MDITITHVLKFDADTLDAIGKIFAGTGTAPKRRGPGRPTKAETEARKAEEQRQQAEAARAEAQAAADAEKAGESGGGGAGTAPTAAPAGDGVPDTKAVRDALRPFSAAHGADGREKTLELLARFDGATNVTNLKPEHRQAVIDAAKAETPTPAEGA